MATTRPTRPKKQQTGRAGRVAFAVLVAAAILSLAFFLLLRTQKEISIAENALGTVLSPIQNALSAATVYVRDLVGGVKDYFHMGEELASARHELDELKLQLSDYQEAALENERLKALLDVKERYEQLDPVYARVISRDPGVYFDTFSVNKGTADDIRVGMAVVTGDGLVGRINEVGSTYAKVMSIIDTRSSVACLISRTRDEGMMYGQFSAGDISTECRMEYLPPVNDVAPGDVVITSGLDKLFPKGIPVGVVTQVSRQPTDTADRSVMVSPSADFLHIEEVLILRTVVETDEESGNLGPMPTLVTRKPSPTPEAEPTPQPTPDPNETDSAAEGVYQYPSGRLTEDGELILDPGTQSGANGQDDDTALPEDDWAG